MKHLQWWHTGTKQNKTRCKRWFKMQLRILPDFFPRGFYFTACVAMDTFILHIKTNLFFWSFSNLPCRISFVFLFIFHEAFYFVWSLVLSGSSVKPKETQPAPVWQARGTLERWLTSPLRPFAFSVVSSATIEISCTQAYIRSTLYNVFGLPCLKLDLTLGFCTVTARGHEPLPCNQPTKGLKRGINVS